MLHHHRKASTLRRQIAPCLMGGRQASGSCCLHAIHLLLLLMPHFDVATLNGLKQDASLLPFRNSLTVWKICFAFLQRVR